MRPIKTGAEFIQCALAFIDHHFGKRWQWRTCPEFYEPNRYGECKGVISSSGEWVTITYVCTHWEVRRGDERNNEVDRKLSLVMNGMRRDDKGNLRLMVGMRVAFNRPIFTAAGDPSVFLAKQGWVGTIVGWDYDEPDGVIVEVDKTGRRFATTEACLMDPPEDAWDRHTGGDSESYALGG